MLEACQLHIVNWMIFTTCIMHNWMKYYSILWCSYILLDSWIYRCADPQIPVSPHPCMGAQILRSQYLYICGSTDPWILKSLYSCIDRSSTPIDSWFCICLYIHSSMEQMPAQECQTCKTQNWASWSLQLFMVVEGQTHESGGSGTLWLNVTKLSSGTDKRLIVKAAQIL